MIAGKCMTKLPGEALGGDRERSPTQGEDRVCRSPVGPSQKSNENIGLSRGLSIAALWKQLKYILNFGPDRPEAPNRPETAAPYLPDIVERSSGIAGFRGRGGGPAGHPHGVQGEMLTKVWVPEGSLAGFVGVHF